MLPIDGIPTPTMSSAHDTVRRARQPVARRGTGVPWLDAESDFRRARRASAIARVGRRLTRNASGDRPRTPAAAIPLAGPARLEMIPLSEIAGTVEPSNQFDARLRPAAEALRHRWARIALARRTGTPLPPIEVLRRPDGFYVVDGRHRVSVARALGDQDIEAWVRADLSRPSSIATGLDRRERPPRACQTSPAASGLGVSVHRT